MENKGNPKRVKKSLFALLVILLVTAVIAIVGLMIEDETDVIVKEDVHQTEADENSGSDSDVREKQKALDLLDTEAEKTDEAIDRLKEKAEKLNDENEFSRSEIEFIETQPDRLKKYKLQIEKERKRVENLDAVRYSDIKEWVDARNPRRN